MTPSPSNPPDTTTLSTKLEEDFVSPLTAVRGSLEILRDFPDLEPRQRQRFVESALQECLRLERGISELAQAVYAAGRHADAPEPAPAADRGFSGRLRVDPDHDVIEIDFSDYEFRNSGMVNEFFDAIEDLARRTGRRWFFLTNFRNCRVWPEAWVAFAHRGKKARVLHGHGSVRYAEHPDGDQASSPGDPDIYPSRAAAVAKIVELKAAKGS